jgi:phosphopentomutase
LTGEHAVGRVIARPFTGLAPRFNRTEKRKDFSLTPPEDTILDVVKRAGRDVMGVGKIEDIFAHRGLTLSNHTGNNMAGVDAILEYLAEPCRGLVFANLVDFDSLYGHRNDPTGYAKALEDFDGRVPEIIKRMRPLDVLIITADHGNDPTTPGTDHTREQVPIMVYGKTVASDNALGERSSFADVAASIADLLKVSWTGCGESFANLLNGHRTH